MSYLLIWSLFMLTSKSYQVLSFDDFNYRSRLTNQHSQFQRISGSDKNYYYETITVTVNESGQYAFFIDSTDDMVLLFYENIFDPQNPSNNQIFSSTNLSKIQEFKLNVSMQADVTYILVVTTYSPESIGQYSIRAFSLASAVRIRNWLSMSTYETSSTNTEPTRSDVFLNDVSTDFPEEPNSSTTSTSTTTSTSATSVTTTTSRTTTTTTTSRTTTTTTTSRTTTTTTTSRTTTTTTTAICYKPEIRNVQPDAGLIDSPYNQLRRRRLTIAISVLTQCAYSLRNITRWSVYACINSTNCSQHFNLSRSIALDSTKIDIPSHTLTEGTYKFIFNISMYYFPNMSASIETYIKIGNSRVSVNLVKFGTSSITIGSRDDLIFDPGKYSIRHDGVKFIPESWFYSYSCRLYSFSNPQEFQSIDSSNNECFTKVSNVESHFKYQGLKMNQSAVTIFGDALKPGKTYQFKAVLVHLNTMNINETGYVVVKKLEDVGVPLISIACVITTMCSPYSEYQYINPSTQVALYSIVSQTDTSSDEGTLRWAVTASQDDTKTRWEPVDDKSSSLTLRYYGTDTSNFTAEKDLFELDSLYRYWRFEVTHEKLSVKSSSAIYFKLNDKPSNGSCTIAPINGTTSTLFTINCNGWTDDDQIEDYLIYAWTHAKDDAILLAAVSETTTQVQLPPGDNENSLVHIFVHIRDYYECVTEYDLQETVTVRPDFNLLGQVIDSLNTAKKQFLTLNTTKINCNATRNWFNGTNIKIEATKLLSLTKLINEINDDLVQRAISIGIESAQISIAPVTETCESHTFRLQMNISNRDDYDEELEKYAYLRECLLGLPDYFPLNIRENILLKSSILSQITQATNQLTQEASLITAKTCLQLAEKLHESASLLPKEDVQLTVNHLTQCASNVLTAINAPLQERSGRLKTDTHRVEILFGKKEQNNKTVPSYIRTQLSSPDDATAKVNNTKSEDLYVTYRSEAANNINDYVTQIHEFVTATLQIHLNIGQRLFINASSVFFTMETTLIESLANHSIDQYTDAAVHFPTDFNISQNSSDRIYIRLIVQPLAPIENSSEEIHTNASKILELSLIDPNGAEVEINTSENDPIELFVPRDAHAIQSRLIWIDVNTSNKTNRTCDYHRVNITKNPNVTIAIHFEILPSNKLTGYAMIYRFDDFPYLIPTSDSNDGQQLLCPKDFSADGYYRLFISNAELLHNSSVTFALREFDSDEFLQYCSEKYNKSIFPDIFDRSMIAITDYQIRSFTSGCYFLDSDNQWKSDGLIVGPMTDYSRTQCFSTHLSKYSSDFSVLSVEIDLKRAFANADFLLNKTIYITVICLIVLYVILVIFARHRDKQDLNKLGITFLADNHRNDYYFYQIIIFTGHRQFAGTDSKVHFLLSGDDDETAIRTFSDPHRKIFQRGSIDGFILAVPRCLGALNYLHLWHDNSGRGSAASWFVKSIIVRDLQTSVKSHFICQRWLAVEEGDGLIERVLPVASEEEKKEFSYVLSKQAYHNVSDGHLWFSIFSRPTSSRFTRVQRCTCCFVLLFTSMLFNMLYCEQQEKAKSQSKSSPIISFGVVSYSTEEIVIGIVVEVLSLVPSLFLVQFFRRIEPKVKSVEQLQDQRMRKKKGSIRFPWWCLYVAYAVSILLVVASIFLIIARGIMLGDRRIQQWLKSLVISFISSMFLTQPLKILCLAIFFSMVCSRYESEEENDQLDDHFDEDSSIRLCLNDSYVRGIQGDNGFVIRSRQTVHRLTRDEVKEARYHRLKQIKMWSIIRELVSYCVFIWMIYVVSYSNRNQHGYDQVNHLRHFLLNRDHARHDYMRIVTVDDYWSWLQHSLMKKIYTDHWYNGKRTSFSRNFLGDRSNLLIDSVTLRQLRIKTKSCHRKFSFRNHSRNCVDDYSRSNEDRQSYQLKWMMPTNMTGKDKRISMSSIGKAFRYRLGKELDTYPYIGQHATYSSGGYVYEFRPSETSVRPNLTELRLFNWIDHRTRAVLIQMTLYNANVEMFTSVSLLMEFLSTGSLIPSAMIQPIALENFSSLIHLIVFILYIFFIIYLIFIEINLFYKMGKNYFGQFWSWIQWGIIICSLIAISIYVWRHVEAERIKNILKTKLNRTRVNLQLAAYVDDVLTFLLGFCCFFSTIKLLRFSRFTNYLSSFGDTLKLARKSLVYFTILFSFLIFAFVNLFYFLFISKTSSCSTLFQTMQTMIEMILKSFRVKHLTTGDDFLVQFAFVLFVFLVDFIGMTIFISIIETTFRFVRKNNVRTNDDDKEMFGFILTQFFQWIGLKKKDDWQKFEQYDQRMRQQYFDPIEGFPNKVEQLFEVLEQMDVEEQKEVLRSEKLDGPQAIDEEQRKYLNFEI